MAVKCGECEWLGKEGRCLNLWKRRGWAQFYRGSCKHFAQLAPLRQGVVQVRVWVMEER